MLEHLFRKHSLVTIISKIITMVSYNNLLKFCLISVVIGIFVTPIFVGIDARIKLNSFCKFIFVLK